MKKIFSFLLLVFIVGATPVNATVCESVAKRVAVEQGGRLLNVEVAVQNGREMCVVIVLVSGNNGEKPRRVEVAVPAKSID